MSNSYKFVREDSIKPELVTAVREVLDYCCQDLGLPRSSVTVRWFEDCTAIECLYANATKTDGEPLRAFTQDAAKPLAGMAAHQSAKSAEIWLDSRRSPAVVAETAAHELRHVWQHRTDFCAAASHSGLTLTAFAQDRLEDDADSYAERALRAIAAASTPTISRERVLASRARQAMAKSYRYRVGW